MGFAYLLNSIHHNKILAVFYFKWNNEDVEACSS